MKNYEFFLTDDSGRRITSLLNVSFMSMSRTLLGYGTFHIGLPFKDFNVYPAFLPDRRVEVWRSPAHGATMRREGSFFLRKMNIYARDEDNVEIIEFYGRSPLDILRRQAVTSTTAANYSKIDKIDDMMKEVVRENFISPVQTAPAGELTCDGDEGMGPSVSYSFFGQNVLDILKSLRDISISMNDALATNRRIFFDVVEGSPLPNGGFGYTFRTYADLRGTDRTGDTIFSVENGNIKSPSYYEDYLDSITKASILNLSTPALNGSATSPDATLSRWNTIVSAQQSSEPTAALNDSKANALLRENRADKSLNVTFLDSPGSNRQPRSLYGVDWDLGDWLPVRYGNRDFIAEVETVYVSINEKGEENIVGMSSPRIVVPPALPTTSILLPTYTGNIIVSSLATTNFNMATAVANQGWLGERNDAVQIRRWLMKFAALSDGTIPASATIVSASLFAYANGDYSSNARTCEVFRPLRVWSPSLSTWNVWTTASNWSTAGGFGAADCDPTVVGSRAFTAAETLNVYKEFVLDPSFIQSFVDGTWTNNGFLLKFQTETDDAYRFNVSVANETNLPYLSVTYR